MTATRGLEGVVATSSSISSIIDDTLTYVGYDIDDLAENASFEEVIYLLMASDDCQKDELAELKQQLADNMLFLKKYLIISKRIQLGKCTQWRHCVLQFLYLDYTMKKQKYV